MITNSRRPLSNDNKVAFISELSFDFRTVVEAATGREALYAFLMNGNFGEKENCCAALPCFAPEGLVAPFMAAGWDIIYYSLEDDFSVSQVEVKETLKTFKIDLFIGVHFFGLHIDFRFLKNICNKKDVIFLEDYTHFLPVCERVLQDANKGELQLISFPKLLGVPDGAMLGGVNPSIVQGINFNKSRIRYVWGNIVLNSLSYIYDKSNSRFLYLALRILGRLLSPYRTLQKVFTFPSNISNWSRQRLLNTDFLAIAQIRSKYWNRYQAELNQELIGGLNHNRYENVVMFGFPLMINRRNEFLAFLKANGIRAVTLINRWDHSSDGQSREVSKCTNRILNKHVILPIQEHLTDLEISFVIEAANKWNMGNKNRDDDE